MDSGWLGFRPEIYTREVGMDRPEQQNLSDLKHRYKGLEQRMWEIDTLDDRITWLESNR